MNFDASDRLVVVPDVHGFHLHTEGGRAVAEGDGVGPIWTEAEARRLVACWNVCRGIPTERLEHCDEPDTYAARLGRLSVEANSLSRAMISTGWV